MSYESKIQESRAKAYERVVATKIIDLMTKLRLSNDGTAERRWVWELLQNAKDVCYKGKKISIEILFQQLNDNNGILKFKHNGRVFSTDNITFLIEQISTKDRSEEDGEQPKTTGKFGTGFLTTHLLSEKVEIDGIVSDEDEKPHKFNLLLDRSGKTIEEIILSVNTSMSLLNKLDNYPSVDYIPADFNTVFCYHLNNKGTEVAKKGIQDLHASLPFTLAFIPVIKSVTIESNDQIITYKYISKKQISDKIQLIKIERTTNSESEKISLILLSNQSTTIAVQIEQDKKDFYLKKLHLSTPRLFCDFPLIGTEDFCIPIVINNPKFYLNEPRSGVFLTDIEQQEIYKNKQHLQEAVELYYDLLLYASQHNWQNLYVLADIKQPKSKDWFSDIWFKQNILKPTQDKLISVPIVDTVSHGRIAIAENIQFPYHKENEIREKIWDLYNIGGIFKLPIKQYLHFWYEIVQLSYYNKYRLTLEDITAWISEQKNLSTLANSLNKTEDETLDWLNRYYQLINFDENILNLIEQNKYAVIPNQNNNFCKKSELFLDQNIEEELKNAIKLLGDDWRDILLKNNVFTGSHLKYYKKTQKDIIEKINNILCEGENIGEACDYLISCFCNTPDFPSKRQFIYDFCKTVYPNDVQEKRYITTWDKNIWKEVDQHQIRWLITKISEQKNINQLTECLQFPDENKTLEWLDSFISFLEKEEYGEKLNDNENPILPNQEGQFKIKDELSLDDEIDETLKDIAANVGYNFREELLDTTIYLELPENRTKKSSDVAQKIEELIKPKFSEIPRTEETQEIFNQLFVWFKNNEEDAKNLFSMLHEKRYNLLDDEEIAKHIEEVPLLKQQNQELTEENIELKEENNNLKEENARLKANQGYYKITTQEITPNILISFGIDSEEKLQNFLSDKEFSKHYTLGDHGSGFSMIMHVKEIIERAKQNVKKYLILNSDYDCLCWNEQDTVITGVKKYGKPIYLVIRPSDGNKIVFYYPNEKTTLSLSNSELWVENGISEPEQITLGIVLDKKSIKEISL